MIRIGKIPKELYRLPIQPHAYCFFHGGTLACFLGFVNDCARKSPASHGLAGLGNYWQTGAVTWQPPGFTCHCDEANVSHTAPKSKHEKGGNPRGSPPKSTSGEVSPTATTSLRHALIPRGWSRTQAGNQGGGSSGSDNTHWIASLGSPGPRNQSIFRRRAGSNMVTRSGSSSDSPTI